jgi:hypothetical protein
MIISHHDDGLTISDGETVHAIKYSEFDWMKPTDAGGIHPAITEDWHTYLRIQDRDLCDCPLAAVPVTIPDIHPGKSQQILCLPVRQFLQAKYGPDDQIITVPMTGDANAQYLHWVKRTPEEQERMKEVLKWLGAWELTEEGKVPRPGDRVIHGNPDPDFEVTS